MTGDHIEPISDGAVDYLVEFAKAAQEDWDRPDEWGSLPLCEYGALASPAAILALVARMRAAEAEAERLRAVAAGSWEQGYNAGYSFGYDEKAHVVHVTVAPVAEDAVWCEACEEWVTTGDPESTLADGDGDRG